MIGAVPGLQPGRLIAVAGAGGCHHTIGRVALAGAIGDDLAMRSG